MKKNIVILLCLTLLTVPMSTMGQSLKDLLNRRASGVSDSLVLKAISPSLSIIRQRYHLEKNGDTYGKANKPYYGETYTLGVKVSGGTILQKDVVYPWLNDKDYLKANASGKYTPKYFSSEQRTLNDCTYRPVELELGTPYVQSMGENGLLYMHSDAYNDFGLSLDRSSETHDGYMVWVYTDTNVGDSAMTVNMKFSTMKLDVATDSVQQKQLSPDNSDKVIGGLYIVPVIERPGHIQLKIAGVASKVEDSKWVLSTFAVPAKSDKEVTQPSADEQKETAEEVNADPTPIKKKKK